MTWRLFSHADDIGLTQGINDGILRCIDAGVINSVSLMVNGWAVDHAVAALTEEHRRTVRVRLHLNLVEGRPIAPPSSLSELVGEGGELNAGFVQLATQFATQSPSRERELRKQLRNEIRAQIEQFLELFGDDQPLHVDSHRHYHLLPGVLEEIVALRDEFEIAGIRLAREPFSRAAGSFPRVSGLVKHFLLNRLSQRALPLLRETRIPFNQSLVGVLTTGSMTVDAVAAALQAINPQARKGDLEILFHPGRALPSERSPWRNRPRLAKYYCSPDRDREAAAVMDPRYRSVLNKYGLSLER